MSLSANENLSAECLRLSGDEMWRRRLADLDLSRSTSRTVVCSGVLVVPFGPECFGGGNFAGQGATTMLRLKKAAGPRTKLQKHDNQDTRVTVDGPDPKKDRKKGNWLKRLRKAVEAFLIRQVLLEIWGNRLEYWEYVCDAMDMLFGLIS